MKKYSNLKVYSGESPQSPKSKGKAKAKAPLPPRRNRGAASGHKEGRRARLGLLFLVLFTVLFAAAALYARYKLDAFRESVIAALETRFGADLRMGPVSFNGLQGLRIDDLTLTVESENGPTLKVKAPVALVYIPLNDLFYGRIRVDRIVADGALFQIRRPEGAQWYRPEFFNLEELLHLSPEDTFRVMGKRSRLEISNVSGGAHLAIEGFGFDVSRPVDATLMTVHLEGSLAGSVNKHVAIRATMADFDDFDLTLEAVDIAAADVNVFLPAAHQLVVSGVAAPTVTVRGRPDQPIEVSLDGIFEDLALRDQPEFIAPASGHLRLDAQYDIDTRTLRVTAAHADSEEIGGTVEGQVLFVGDYPQLDLRLKANRIPIKGFLSQSLDGEIDEYGEVQFTLDEPHELVILLEGTTNEPLLKAVLRAGSGDFSFVPHDESRPEIALRLGNMEGAWDSLSQSLTVKVAIEDGVIEHSGTELVAERVYGTVEIIDEVLSFSPMNMEVTGNALVGSLSYNLFEDVGDLVLSGTLAEIENTIFADILHDTLLSGEVRIDVTATKGVDSYEIDAFVDATQSQWDYSWWLRKPVGIGATGSIHATLKPEESAEITFENIEFASSQFSGGARVEFVEDEGESKWRLEMVEVTSDHLDVTALGTCFNVPYKITGGIGTSAHGRWERVTFPDVVWAESLACHFDEVSFLPEVDGAESPFRCEDLTVQVDFDRRVQESTGKLTLYARDATVPAFGETWFLPLAPEGVISAERSWTYTLSADHLVLAPWEGSNFSAQAFSHATESGFESFGADIGEGRLDGHYRLSKPQNLYAMDISWTNIPATYFIEHLHYPDVLQGSVSGGVKYSLDQDDPSTLDGTGSFEITDGKFSADFLYSILQDHVEGDSSVLPPSLEFTKLKTDVTFKRDIVETPNIELVSEGIGMKAEGFYVRDGDMDYKVHLAIAPTTAEKIQLLVDNFNVQGHRLSKKPIELAFKIDGPTFNPQGRLSELPPASVTFLSGALEVTSEAIRVIDIPRQILMDLLKLGGGIVGAGKS